MRLLFLIVLVLGTTSCLDVSLPPRRTSTPGTVRATLLLAAPGQTSLQPAVGATVEWSLSSQQAVADDEGNVLLTGVTSSEGLLRFRAGGFERLLDARLAQVGFGRDVNLGTLVLGRAATIGGRVRRGDRPSLTSGHAGIAVFVAETPLITQTGDTGDFVLSGVGEGDVTVSFFASGYAPFATRLSVRAGERLTLDELRLEPGALTAGSELSATITDVSGQRLSNATGRLEGGARVELLNVEGALSGSNVPAGLYDVIASAPGFRTLRLSNRLVLPPSTRLGQLTLSPGADPVDAGPGPSPGRLRLTSTLSSAAAPPLERQGLRLRVSELGTRTRVCSGTLCMTGELKP